MSYRKKIYLLLSLSLLAFVLILVSCSRKSGWCYDFAYHTDYAEGIMAPIILFSVAIFILSILLLFSHEEVFRTWSKFAIIYIPIAFAWIIATSLAGGGGGWAVSSYGSDPSEIAWLTSILFLLFSLIIIFWKWRKIRARKIV